MTQAMQRWSYSTGERGRNRVRAFVHPNTGTLFLEYRSGGQRKRKAVGTRDRETAKQQADELAAKLGRNDVLYPESLTLATLFDIYLREVTPGKGRRTQQHDRYTAALLLECLGGSRPVATLTRRDWEQFIRWRRQRGDPRQEGRAIRDGVIGGDFAFLRAVLRWAVGSGLVERNPVQGLPVPTESAPNRPVLRQEEYEALLQAAPAVSPLLRLALVLAHETGHRIGAITQLRWSDVDLQRGVIRWRAASDKIGFEHETMLTPTAMRALEQARADHPAIGDAWVLPHPRHPTQPVTRDVLQKNLGRAEIRAGLPHQSGRGFHALRRKFATELKHIPLKDLCALGGWKHPQTVLTCYQTADEATMREALATRRTLRSGSQSTH